MSSVRAVVRHEIKVQYHNQCQFCFKHYKPHLLQIHHILPRSRKGTDEPSNLIPLCGGNGSNNCHLLVHKFEITHNSKGNRILYAEEKQQQVINIFFINLGS